MTEDQAKPTRRLDASMTLLVEAMERPLDAGYAEAAARRKAAEENGGVPRRSAGTWIGVALLAGAIGLSATVATVQLRVPQPGAGDARAALERQVEDHKAALLELESRAEALAVEIDTLGRAVLDLGAATGGDSLLEVIDIDLMHNGAEALAGPGLIVTLGDGGGGLIEDPDPNSLVHSSDLRDVVNALWAAGAEAISVDDQRLTVTTSIRNVGTAVLVNLVPLSGPTYVVRALGDPTALMANLNNSDLPARLTQLGASFGIRSSLVPQSRLELPGSGAQPLQYARFVGPDSLGSTS